MKERDDNRILGAIRWIDGVTSAQITFPLAVSAPNAKFVRNLSGLSVISSAAGLNNYTTAFDLTALPAPQRVANQSLSFTGQVADPSGVYLPRVFTIKLPRDESPALLPPDNHRPANSLFTPQDVVLLPAPAAPMSAGFAQVRLSIADTHGVPLPNVLARVVATADNTVLGRGMSDPRGEALVAVPFLKLFAPGGTPDEVVTRETEARLELLFPPANQPIVDWTVLDATAVDPAHVDPVHLQLVAGGVYSRKFPFPP